jgi:hypothetical protein
MMVGGSGMEGMEMSSTTGAGTTHPMAMQSQKAAPAHGALQMSAKVVSGNPKLGSNLIEVSVSRDGKPMSGLKLTAQVAMLSMDMGTEEPAVKETAPGRYQLKAGFSMEGPWAVKISSPEGGGQTFRFEVGQGG